MASLLRPPLEKKSQKNDDDDEKSITLDINQQKLSKVKNWKKLQKINRSLGICGTISKSQSSIPLSLRNKRDHGEEKIFEDIIDEKFSKFGGKHKSTD